MHYTEPSVPEEVAQVTENGSEVAVFTEEDEFSQNETTATQMDVTMMHLVEDENGNVNVVDMTQEGTASVETDAAGSVQKAEFETTSFSTFTITWKKNDTFGTNLIIKYVDEEGNEINAENVENVTIGPENTTDNKVDLSSYQKAIVGYEYKATKLDSYQGENISYVRIKPLGENSGWTEERVPQVSADGNNWIDVKKSSVIYMVYQKTSSSGAVSDLKVQRQKYIDKNEDGTYDITLNVSGSVETQITKAKVDVVMIADVSGSMEGTKLTNMKSAINTLVATFDAKGETVDTKYQLVTFATEGTNVTNGWESGTEFKKAVGKLEAEGGTNYHDGLTIAKTCLDAARTDAIKIVIFLTDGQPTYYVKQGWDGQYYVAGRGGTTSENTIINALNAAGQITCDKFYAVGIGLPDKIKDGNNSYNGKVFKYDDYSYRSDYKDDTKGIDLSKSVSGLQILQWLINEVNADTSNKEAINYSSDNSQALTNKFQSIAGSALEFACSGVNVQDTLSQYVETTANSKLEIKVMSKSTNNTYTEIEKVVGGNNLADTTVDVDSTTITAKYNNNTKTVTLEFPPDYKLKADYYYYVTITNLKPTNKAYEDYQKSGYNAAGDKLTDASEDKNSGVDGGRSSEQAGFYSNTEAKVTYTYKGQTNSVDYPKPVIQVIASDLIKSKTAKVVDWDQRTYNITLNASSVMEEVKAANPVDVVLVFDKSGSMKFRSKLVKDKVCKVSDLDSKTTYYYIAPEESATMYRVWKSGKNWYYLDDSKSSGGTKITKDSEILNQNTKYQFYTDGDPGHDRLYYLKAAATQFTTQLAQVSPKSKVALVSFANDSTVDFEMNELNTGNLSTLNGKINNLTTSSKTRQNEGLKTAANILNAKKSGNKQYVILLTDGCPNGDGCSYDTIGDAANTVKNITNSNGINTTLMTVSVGLVDNDYLEIAKTNLKSYASKDSNGNPYSYDADSADQLVGIFKSILKSITAKAPITNVDVIDYIDPNFELTEQTKKDLTAAGVEYDKDAKGYYVKWSNQTIPEAGANGTAGWSKTIQVKAKDNFIGGNNIPTNGAGSGVIVKGQLLEFEQPHVNVKVKMEVANKTVTIYKGDEMPTNPEILNQLFDKTNTTTSYSASKVNANNVSITWYKDPECTKQVTDFSQLSDAEKKPVAETNYYIKVTYNAGAPSAESNQNTIKDGTTYYAGTQQGTSYIESAVNKDNADQKYGIYTVKVISGQIEITKKVDVVPTEDKDFYFVVTKDGKPYGDQLKVTVKAGSEVGEAAAKLENLERGTYVITEAAAEGYVVGGTETAGTNCKVLTGDNKEITFKLGFKNDDKKEIDVIQKETDSNGKIINCTYEEAPSGTLGKVEYTNSEIKANLDLKKIADTQDKTTYLKGAKFKLQKKNTTTGKWEDETSYVDIEVDNGTKVELNNLRNGDYSLTETKAPDGYSKLGSSIYFKVENGTVTLTGENGKPLGEGFELWQLDTRSTTPVLTIKNQKLYSLPESGGSGIYWYMIGGMVLMSAAAWILYKNKCREVLGK